MALVGGGSKHNIAIDILAKRKPASAPMDGMGEEAGPSSDHDEGVSAAAGDMFDALKANDRSGFQTALKSMWDIYSAKVRSEDIMQDASEEKAEGEY